MRRYLSVDCGGTKTAFLLCRETGELEAACTLGPGNYMVNGIDHVLSVLKDGILQICCQAAIAQSEITHSFIAIAGFKDIPVYVSYSGGVFKAMKYIKETLEEELRDVSCVFTEPCLLPSAGGIILACRAAGNEVSEQMIENLRTAQHMRV